MADDPRLSAIKDAMHDGELGEAYDLAVKLVAELDHARALLDQARQQTQAQVRAIRDRAFDIAAQHGMTVAVDTECFAAGFVTACNEILEQLSGWLRRRSHETEASISAKQDSQGR